MDYFNEAETWDRAKIEEVQLTRLRSTLWQAAKCSFYANRFKSADIDIDALSTFDAVSRLPMTTKDDLRGQYPMGLLCVPQSEIIRMHCSSGTTGVPTAICHTQNDINSWAELMARSMYMVGVRKEDVFQNMSGYGLFTGGLGIHYGAERLGCLTIPAGAGNSRRQLKLMSDFGTTVVHILPSYSLILGQKAVTFGYNPQELPWKIAIVGAEPYTVEFRNRIEKLFNIKVYNSYGLSEMNGPGVAFECEQQYGLHIWEDAFLPEIVNPETGIAVPEGEVGELIMTTLCRQGMPIIRYRTRDLTRFLPGECACGRKHRRIDRILGRTDDMFIIKGVNIYPMQIEQVIMSFSEVGQNYLIVLENNGLSDDVRIKVEINAQAFVEDMRYLHNLQKKITNSLRDEILITPKVEFVQSGSIPQAEGKAVRVQDLRNCTK